MEGELAFSSRASDFWLGRNDVCKCSAAYVGYAQLSHRPFYAYLQRRRARRLTGILRHGSGRHFIRSTNVRSLLETGFFYRRPTQSASSSTLITELSNKAINVSKNQSCFQLDTLFGLFVHLCWFLESFRFFVISPGGCGRNRMSSLAPAVFVCQDIYIDFRSCALTRN